MRSFTKKPATYEDLKKVPDTMLAQIVDGELYALPRPSVGHQHVSSQLGADLLGPFGRGRGGPGGWWILDEPELHLGPDILVPDLAGWRRERVAALPSGAFISIAPDWICEVLSPSTAAFDRVRKMRVYARERVSHAWLIDPVGKTLEIFRWVEGKFLGVATHATDEKVRAEPFDAIELDLSQWWPPTADDPQRTE